MFAIFFNHFFDLNIFYIIILPTHLLLMAFWFIFFKKNIRLIFKRLTTNIIFLFTLIHELFKSIDNNFDSHL